MNRAIWWTAFLLALAAAALSGFLAYRALAYTRAFEEADAASFHSAEVVEATDGLTIALQDAQRGLRGYLLTRDERFLEPWHAGLAGVPRQIERLRQLAEGRSHMRLEVEALSRCADEVLAFGRRGLVLAQAGRWTEAEGLVRTGEGKRVVDDTRTLIESLKGGARFERDMRRSTAQQMAHTSMQSARWLMMLALAIVSALVVGAWIAIRKGRSHGSGDIHQGPLDGPDGLRRV